MTYEDAIEILSKHTVDMGKKSKRYAEAIKMAIVALEKQIPKIPTVEFHDGRTGHICCSVCHSDVEADENYCWCCGIKLDWSDEE